MARLPLEPCPPRIGGVENGLHIVLVEPLIPSNTGNVARLCAATGAWLHLVEPLGFTLDDSRLKRAGLDYWPNVRMSIHAGFASVEGCLEPGTAWFFTKHASQPYTRVDLGKGGVLVFGSETKGLPVEIQERYAERLVKIPISRNVRSLNLANAVGIALYEAVRQLGLKLG